MAPKRKEVSSTYIPNDIYFSILSKLSVKSLYRFSCVRKSWNHLFQNPNFINMFRKKLISESHSLNDENDVYLILHQADVPEMIPACSLNWYLLYGDRFQNKLKLNIPSPFSIVWRNDVASIRILGSAVNGMLYVYNCNGWRCHDDTNGVLWNLDTEEIKVIPRNLPKMSNPNMVIDVFIPHGFGYDHVRDDYKVIQHVDYIVDYEDDDDDDDDDDAPHPFWEIYSLKSNSWRKLGFDMPTRASTDADVYMNGVCHWLGETIDKTCVVVSFNLSNEVFFITPLPPDCFDVNLVVLNGYFTMISNYKKTGSFHISILGEFGVKESWIRIFDIGPLSCIEHPIGIGKDKVFFRKKDDELVCFNLTTGMIEEIGVKGKKCWCQMIIYKKKNFTN